MYNPDESVFDYFRRKLGRDSSDSSLKELPLNSNCGADCKKAIKRCRKFLKSVDMAFGKIDYGQYEKAIEVCDRVIQCFAHG